ncbi:S41 family peptidase [Chitinophaga nivalis]|uniref:S41 family peptidase n=1 Tax=Chitinophaga nivalis TaxID=2991709 RepID=A0ABT3IU93_9BACT|nr:S41 family peptidase [Chitinophaga nivalis]MCW3462820.1 S41 family peptidase [Chitinophaga nivalis]MCW3487490.1 S41 family peptidase [Chitinophaga nivalis]
MRNYLLGVTLLLCACSKKDQPAPPPPRPSGPATQQDINKWILDSMRHYYLWNDQLPTTVDATLSAPDYFQSIKNANDPFSLLYNPGNWNTYPRYMFYNYGMNYNVIPWPSAPGGAIGVIELVIPGSNAAAAGFSRGHYFTRINGTPLTAANAPALTAQVLKTGEGAFTPATINNGMVTEGQPRTVLLGIATENPLYANSVMTVENKKIAYLFYNAFNDIYNQELITAFRNFKSQGATELILDMRYNTGGSLAAAATLSTLIAPGIAANTPFVQYTGNSRLPFRQLDFSTTMSYPESGNAIPFNQVQPASLSLQRVYILTGHETISAAELTINNLKPYTKVIQIGQTTFGKDKGAITIKENSGWITWILQPITYRLANARGEGNYTKGIAPDHTIDEMNTQPLLALGDSKDPLIAKALALITGHSRKAAVPESITSVPSYFHTQQKVQEVILPR